MFEYYNEMESLPPDSPPAPRAEEKLLLAEQLREGMVGLGGALVHVALMLLGTRAAVENLATEEERRRHRHLGAGRHARLR